MGATNCPETPRQKMISMMYLVYLALLALNVSAMLLNSFITVSDTMDKSNHAVMQKVDDTYTKFANFATTNPEKAGDYYKKALEVKKLSEGLRDYIDSIKYDFIGQLEKVAEYHDTATGEKVKESLLKEDGTVDIAKVKNIVGAVGVGFMKQLSADAAAQNHFLGSGEFDPTNEELRSVQIRKHIEKYKADVRALLDGIEIEFPGLDVEGEVFTLNVHGKAQKGVWERHIFESNIPVADVVLLTRLTTDIMNCEFDLAELLYKSVNADDFKFDQVRARVIPKATTVMQGDNYEADIFVAAYDSKADLRVKVNGKEIIGSAADSGSVHWVVGTGGLGVQKYSGEIYVKKESGEVAYPFSGEYFVTMPNAVVSLTNMNVIYAGIDNPFSVSVPGVNSKDVFVTASSGTIRPNPDDKSGGSYVINVTKVAPITMTVEANIDGKRKKMGEFKYRCKSIPAPILKFGKNEGNCSMKPEELRAIRGFKVAMKDFEFKIPPLVVTSYSFNIQGSGKSDIQVRNTDRFDPEMMSMLEKARRGQKVYIDDVKVKTPDGRVHTLNATVKML